MFFEKQDSNSGRKCWAISQVNYISKDRGRRLILSKSSTLTCNIQTLPSTWFTIVWQLRALQLGVSWKSISFISILCTGLTLKDCCTYKTKPFQLYLCFVCDAIVPDRSKSFRVYIRKASLAEISLSW